MLVVRLRHGRSGCSRVARGHGRPGRRRCVRRARGRDRGRGRGGGGERSGRQLELVELAVADRGREGEERVSGSSGGSGGSRATSRAQERLARDGRGRGAE